MKKFISLMVLTFATVSVGLFAADQQGVMEVSQSNFKSVVIESQKPVVVVVSAVWCKPCQQLKPIVNSVAQKMSGTHKFVKLDFDQNSNLASQYLVQSLPTILYFKDGQLKGRTTGMMTEKDLEAKVQSLL